MMGNPNLWAKKEIFEPVLFGSETKPAPQPISVIDLSSSDSDADESLNGSSSEDNNNTRPRKKKRVNESVTLPLGFLEPLSPSTAPSQVALAPALVPEPALVALALPAPGVNGKMETVATVQNNSKQFWKAGDYEELPRGGWEFSSGGMDHVRVHPKFLHSNATSHKWVLGAFAELLDNSLDEACNGATYVNINMIENKNNGSRMLLIEDNGGGMDPDRMRQCMSLGYSAKSKMADTIGQYGNGFKTSTMRLGADVIVFSRSCGRFGNSSTQSIGLLSYTFLRSTGKEDIVVPMLDYEKRGESWEQTIRSSATDWSRNIETIVRWSPFSSEVDLLRQFSQMKSHGTRIIIYNLWEDDQGLLELDFDADPHDIQIRGVNRDEKNIQMARQYPNSKHFLTYRHSLRSYASILYLRVPPGFRIILRGKDVEHHNIVNDMMMTQEVTYRPQPGSNRAAKDSNMVAVVAIGFVKDAKAHIDVQGFNVYHKNRLIKPFWRVWHPPGSVGRGVIGVLEANFVEPAHDKQGFERTTVLSRLEAKLVQMQKTYWIKNCHKIGYASRNKKSDNEKERSPDYPPSTSQSKGNTTSQSLDNNHGVGHLYKEQLRNKISRKRPGYFEQSPPPVEDLTDEDLQTDSIKRQENGCSGKSSQSNKFYQKEGPERMHSSPGLKHTEAEQNFSQRERTAQVILDSRSKEDDAIGNEPSTSYPSLSQYHQLKEENCELRERLKRKEEEILGELLHDLQFEKDRCQSLEAQLQEAKQKIEELNKEQESLIDIFSEERQRRDIEEENLRKKLKDASRTIQELLDKVRVLEKVRPANGK